MSASSRGKQFLFGLLAALALVPINEAPGAPRSSAAPGALSALEALDSASLKSITAWLKQSGREGYLAADVADAAGIPRARAEDAVAARQRGFKSGNVLRIAQIPADGRRDFVLFMVQRPEGEVFFYLSTVKDGLRKAFVSIPGQAAVLPLETAEAQSSFQRELLYWEARIAGS